MSAGDDQNPFARVLGVEDDDGPNPFARVLGLETAEQTSPAPPAGVGTINPLTKHWEPTNRARAVFSDVPGQSFTAEQLAGVKEDQGPKKKAAFLGGALQGATLGFSDELGAAAGAIMGKGSYKGLRAENRDADQTAEKWSPSDYAAGKLAGGAATAFVPGLAPAGKLLSGANTLRAAAVGGAQALGESKADITEGDIGPAFRDAARGAAVGAGVNTGLGLMGAGYRGIKGYVGRLPEALAKKADDQLIDATTLGAPASKRDALMGYLGQDRPDVLKLIRENPEIEAALQKGDRKTAAKLVIAARARHDEGVSAEVAGLQSRRGNAAAAPIIARLEKQRIAAAAIPSAESQAEAVKTQKLIDLINEKWMPAPPVPAPKGPELLAKLAEKADTGDKQRIGSNAESFLQVAEKHKLGEVANDPIATEARIDESLKSLGDRREKLYDQVKEPLLITDLTIPLAKWRNELAENGATIDDAGNVDHLIKNIWKAHGQDSKLTISPKEARALISGTQAKAFAGAYIDPGLAKEMQRKAAGVMKDALDQHVERSVSPTLGQDLRQLNQEYSALLTFKTAAEKRAAEARMLPPVPPETRTGTAPIADIRQLAQTTENPETRQALTSGLHEQLPSEEAQRLAEMDRRGDLMSRLQAPLEHKAAREAQHQAATGGGMLGLGLTASGHHLLGASAVLAGLAAKYGTAVGAKAERALDAMVAAQRIGATERQLSALGRAAGLTATITHDLMGTILPRMAASKVTK